MVELNALEDVVGNYELRYSHNVSLKSIIEKIIQVDEASIEIEDVNSKEAIENASHPYERTVKRITACEVETLIVTSIKGIADELEAEEVSFNMLDYHNMGKQAANLIKVEEASKAIEVKVESFLV